MFEYTLAYLSPFSWAKQVYEANFGLTQPKDGKILITESALVAPSFSFFDDSEIEINTAGDWNTFSKIFLANLGAAYKAQDQAQTYLDGIYGSVYSRFAESEERLKVLENKLKVVSANQQRGASTGIDLLGGDFSNIDLSNKFYKRFPPLAGNIEEGVFRLKDGGYFSSIRSLGGFAGSAAVEKSLLSYQEQGNLGLISDGSRNSFWMATAYAPAPVRSNSSQIPWLPTNYQYGFAILLSYYIDRPTLATEVFIDPIVSEPVDLLSISWAPANQTNQISSKIYSASGWVPSGLANFVNFGTVNASSAVVSISTSGNGWVGYTFAVPTITNTTSGAAVNLSNRAQLSYFMQGSGDCKAGARIYWLDSAGGVINYSRDENYPTAFWSNWSLIDFIPNNATSGIVQLGVFNTTTGPASAYFDDAVLYIGDEVFYCNEKIDRPTTIQLPKPVLSGRYTFTFSQRNTRKEIIAKAAVTEGFDIPNDIELDVSTQKLLKKAAKTISSPGRGENIFAYRIGFKELDLRYREHFPRGTVVSKPLRTNREIRDIWVTSELGRFYTSGVKFKIYPFADDSSQSVELLPWRISSNFQNSNFLDGEVLKIYSAEEVASGLYNPLDTYYIAPERVITEVFNGTNSQGKIKLNDSPHLRRATVKRILNWLDKYSIWPAQFDPNSSVIYGFASDTFKEAIRSNAIPSGLQLTDILSDDGYIPIKVTISTDKWTAHPDTFGKPDVSKVRRVVGETLLDISGTSETQVTSTQNDATGYEAWVSVTTFRQLTTLLPNLEAEGVPFRIATNIRLNSQLNPNKSLKTMSISPVEIDYYRRELTNLYNRLLNSGRINLQSSQTTTSVYVIPQNSIFATKYSPILTGAGGSYFKLFWFNSDPASGGYLPIPRGDYEILDTLNGRIKILKDNPVGYGSVVADYLYLNNGETEDFFSAVLGTISSGTSAPSGIASEIEISARSFPITRNMTDYTTGRPPKLRPPNFVRLSADYYPVIEYYVNSDGELVFSRDFYTFGDLPAQIKVQYETLGISPRVSVEVTRRGTVAATPTIKSIGLRVKEALGAPNREVE